jgi:hypothetical protein
MDFLRKEDGRYGDGGAETEDFNHNFFSEEFHSSKVS